MQLLLGDFSVIVIADIWEEVNGSESRQELPKFGSLNWSSSIEKTLQFQGRGNLSKLRRGFSASLK